MAKARSTTSRKAQQMRLRSEWERTLGARMARFEEAHAEVIDRVERHGPHAASPINLDLVTMVNLLAGWVTCSAAEQCEHCSAELGFTEREGDAYAALQDAATRYAKFTADLLVVIGDEDRASEEPTPWLPDWARPKYDAYLKRVQKKLGTSSGGPTGLQAVVLACMVEPWMVALRDNYLQMLLMEFAVRLVPRAATSPAISAVQSRWPAACVHEAFKEGAGTESEELPGATRQAAFSAAHKLFEQYLEEHDEDDELTLPPPGVALH